LGDLAKQHQAQDATDQIQVAKALQAQNDAIAGIAGNKQGPGGEDGKFPELSEPHIVLSSPAGIASTTPGTTHQHSGRHHAITSGLHTSISAAKSLLVSAKESVLLFAYKTGIKLVAAAADVEVQALEKSIHILSKVSITEAAENITFSAKEELVINGGGSYTTFNANLAHKTKGAWTMNSATTDMGGPKSKPVVMPQFPAVSPFDEQFQAFNQMAHKPVQSIPFTLQTASGEVMQGLTDKDGKTPRILGMQPEALELKWGGLQEGGLVEDVSATDDHDHDGC
jgi:type VI secretion system secreted protein VgrG